MRIEAHLPLLASRLQRIAGAARPLETGGIISVGPDIIQMPNLGADPEAHFNLGPLHDIESREGKPLAIWHTHPADESPSQHDVAACRATALPWIIAGQTKVWALHPRPIQLEGREFVYGIEDCWQAVSDWFATRGLFLPWFPRPPDGFWREQGPSPYCEAAESFGFDLRPYAAGSLASLKIGDVLLMRIAGLRINHAAVYCGGGAIFHHLYGCLSVTEQFDDRFQSHSHLIGRHKTFA